MHSDLFVFSLRKTQDVGRKDFLSVKKAVVPVYLIAVSRYAYHIRSMNTDADFAVKENIVCDVKFMFVHSLCIDNERACAAEDAGICIHRRKGSLTEMRGKAVVHCPLKMRKHKRIDRIHISVQDFKMQMRVAVAGIACVCDQFKPVNIEFSRLQVYFKRIHAGCILEAAHIRFNDIVKSLEMRVTGVKTVAVAHTKHFAVSVSGNGDMTDISCT